MKALLSVFSALALLAGAAAPAAATPASEKDLEAHLQIVEALNDAKVPLSVNPKMCEEYTDYSGFYFNEVGRKTGIVICQENREKRDKIVDFTDYDLDTLRHEVVHLLQDCEDGRIGDGQFASLFTGEEKVLKEMITDYYGEERAKRDYRESRKSGLSPHRAKIELEASVIADSYIYHPGLAKDITKGIRACFQ